METFTPKDWFLPAIETDGTVGECLSAVQQELDNRSAFVSALKKNLAGTGNSDAVTSLSLRLKSIENTFRFRLSILRAERPGAWFRSPAATQTGPFSASIISEPVFAAYDAARVDEVRSELKQRWISGRCVDLPFDSAEPCLWRSLLELKSAWESLCVLPVPYQEYRFDRLPDGLPKTLESRALRAFLLNVRTEIIAISERLEIAFEQLWIASERLWEYQKRRIQDTTSSAGRHSAYSTAHRVRSEFRQRRIQMPSLRSGQDSEALTCMGFSEFPSPDVLRQRYRELAKRWHPDLNKGNEEDFKRLNRAYSHLSSRVGATA